MTDLFAVLAQPRRPWLDLDSLKERYHQLTRTSHPDVSTATSTNFDSVNEAYRVLLDPKLRLQHLLALEAPALARAGRDVPGDLQEIFVRLGALTQNTRSLLQKRADAQSDLSRSLLQTELKMRQGEIAQFQSELAAAWAGCLAELKRIDQEWLREPAAAIEELRSLYERLSYVSRWREQLQEMQLGFA